jgi:hypothetical protein
MPCSRTPTRFASALGRTTNPRVRSQTRYQYATRAPMSRGGIMYSDSALLMDCAVGESERPLTHSRLTRLRSLKACTQCSPNTPDTSDKSDVTLQMSDVTCLRILLFDVVHLTKMSKCQMLSKSIWRTLCTQSNSECWLTLFRDNIMSSTVIYYILHSLR